MNRSMRNACRWLCIAIFTGVLCHAEGTKTAVLLELFTSEGCSSCPPADQILTKLDREQPVRDVDLIVLGEHVDYWNHDGWVDPFSSAAFSARQQRYATLLRKDDIYTPQLVVDGGSEVVGNSWPKAMSAIEMARHSRKLDIVLTNDSSGVARSLTIRIVPDSRLPTGDVYVALAANAAETQVGGGENSGRHLSHTAVVYSMKKIGQTGRDSAFGGRVEIPTRSKWGGPARLVVFVQDPRTGHVLGASQAHPE